MQNLTLRDVNARLDWLGGKCPVQAEGTIGKKRFYFRSRWNSWRLHVGGRDIIANPEFTYSEQWGDEPGAAGYMTEETALLMVIRGLEAFKSWDGDNVQKGNT